MFQPFDNPAKPFIIGLAPVDPQGFILLDDDRQMFQAQKQELYATRYTDVCRFRDDTVEAQREAAQLLEEALLRQYIRWFEVTETALTDRETGASRPRPSHSTTPLADIALFLQDDLLLMRRDHDGWRLVAASLCFPSSWNLHDKFDKPLEAIHGPVPMEDKMHARIRRIFDAMKSQTPLWRENWGISTDGGLRHERRENDTLKQPEDFSKPLHLRIEYQTLHKLKGSQDILFTVGVRTRSMEELAQTGTGQEALQHILDHYRAMSDSQRLYKGLAHDPDAFINRISTLIAA